MSRNHRGWRRLPLALARRVGDRARSGRRAVGPDAGVDPEDRRRVHRAHQAAPDRHADLDRAGRSPAGVRQSADAAQVSGRRPHLRHARRADVREGHPRVHEGGGRRGADAREVLGHRPDRRGPRSDRPRDLERGDDQEPRSLQGLSAGADRSAQDDRGAGAPDHHAGQADLLADERRALDRARRPRDADGAGLPAGRLRDAVHPADPQQRDHVHHAGRRSGRPRADRGHRATSTRSARPKGCRARSASRTGASTSRTTTTATAWASSSR